MTTVLLFLSPRGKAVMASIVMVALIYIWVSLPWFYRSFEHEFHAMRLWLSLPPNLSNAYGFRWIWGWWI